MVQEPQLRIRWLKFWRNAFFILAVFMPIIICGSVLMAIKGFTTPTSYDPVTNTSYYGFSGIFFTCLGVVALAFFPSFIRLAWRANKSIEHKIEHHQQLMMIYLTRSRPTYSQQPSGTYYPQKTVYYNHADNIDAPITSSQQSSHEVQMNISLRNEIISLINRLSKYDAKRTNNLDYDFDLLFQGRVVGVGQIIQHIPTKQEIVALSNIRFQQKTKLAYLFTTATVTDELKSQSEFQRVRLFDSSDIATMRKKALN